MKTAEGWRSDDRATGWQQPLRDHATVVGACIRLEAVRTLRSRQYQLLAVGIPLGLYLVITAGNPEPWATAAVSGPSWRAQAMVALATLGALGAGLASGGSRMAVDRASGWLRTLVLVPLPRLDLLVGRVATGVALAGIPILLLAGIAAVLEGVALSPAGWAQLVASIWIGAVPFALLGTLVGRAPCRGAARALGGALFGGVAGGGGVVVPPRTLPAPGATIGWVVPSYVVGDLAWQAILGQPPSPLDITLLVAQSLALGAVVAWPGHGIPGRPRRPWLGG